MGSSNCTKSAKDLAFDKERIKFRKEINRLTETINRNDDYIVTLQRTIKSRDSEIEQLKFKSIDKKPMTFCLGENNAEKLSKFIINDLGYHKQSDVAKEILKEFMSRIEINEDSTICLSDILVVAKRYNINIKDLIK